MGICQYLRSRIEKLYVRINASSIIADRSEFFRQRIAKIHRTRWGDSWYRAGVLIVNDKEELLLVEELRTRRNGVWYDSHDMWNIASGSCKEDEQFIDAAIREAREELGRGVRLKGICAIKHGKHNDDPCLLIVFLAELTDEVFDFDHKEIKSQRLFSQEDIYELLRQDKLRSPDLVLQALINYRQGLIMPLDILNEISPNYFDSLVKPRFM